MFRMKSGLIMSIGLVVWSSRLLAQADDMDAATKAGPVLAQTDEVDSATKAGSVGAGLVYSLEQFGAVTNVVAAEAAFQKASNEIIAGGGGILLIPVNTIAAWKPKNNTQHEIRIPAAPASAKSWRPGIGITVVDARGWRPSVQPPQATGMEFNRVLDLPAGESMPSWDMEPVLTLNNTILRGSTSYHDWLQEDVKAGADRRFYVATIRGVFPGEFLNAMTGHSNVPRLYVKTLGYDREKKLWYFVADTPIDVNKRAILSNKNHVNSLMMKTASHTENQTFDVWVERHNYSQGDNYIFDARNIYMGDAHSTAGDENNVLYAAFVVSDATIFQSVVEKWNAATGELVYTNNAKGNTLGTGRPIINLNPAKWITNGTVMIVRPASATEYGLNQADPQFHGQTYPTTVETNRIGMRQLSMGGLIRFSADAPVTDEAVGRYFAVDEADEYVPKAKTVRRWYLIDSVTKNTDGTKDLRIIRHWWGAKSAGSPTLYKPENYSWDGHEKPLHYVIAPGANAYDVADGVNNPKRTIRLAPAPFTGTPADFAALDPIEQAIGPDPFKPIPFRSWMWDKVPGAFPATVFDIANNGDVMRESYLWIHGNSSGDVEKDKLSHYDRNPPWNTLMRLDSTCNTGIRFGADTADAALFFAQPYHVQPLKWNYDISTNHAPKVASLTVSRETGDFTFSGGLVTAAGLSGGDKPARNLRGLNQPVPAGGKELVIKFPQAETDNAYMVVLQLSWLTNQAIINRTAEGFTVQFATPPAAAGELSWLLVR